LNAGQVIRRRPVTLTVGLEVAALAPGQEITPVGELSSILKATLARLLMFPVPVPSPASICRSTGLPKAPDG